MAVCDWCKKDMLKVDGCSEQTVLFPDGVTMKSIPYNKNKNDRCHDCNVKLGEFHHPGCDMERCPRCGGQLILCGCLDKDED